MTPSTYFSIRTCFLIIFGCLSSICVGWALSFVVGIAIGFDTPSLVDIGMNALLLLILLVLINKYMQQRTTYGDANSDNDDNIEDDDPEPRHNAHSQTFAASTKGVHRRYSF